MAALAVVAGLSVSAVGCKTTPVSPDGCKAIEEARCRTIVGCPSFENLDVDSCIRFYDDQCLHGFSSDTDPGDPQVNNCVKNIEAWGADKTKQDECLKTAMGTDAQTCLNARAVDCNNLQHPETTLACAFLVPAVVDAGTDSTDDADAATDVATEADSTTE